MKNQLMCLLAIALFALVSCTETTTTTETTETEAAPDYAAFNEKVDLIRAFYKAHSNEDMETVTSMVADDVQWSPPYYNGNQYLGKEEFLDNLKAYHEQYDNIKYTEGIVLPDSTVGGFWSGSVFPEESATSEPGIIRVYGTWSATHVESGQEMGLKFYALVTVNDEDKISFHSEYFDLNSLVPKDTAQAE